MNDFVVLIIIWITITLISQLFKKSKKTLPRKLPAGTQPTTSREPEIPPFLRDLFGLPSTEPVPPEKTVEDEASIDLTDDTYTETPEYQKTETGETDQFNFNAYKIPQTVIRETESDPFHGSEIKKLKVDQIPIRKKRKKNIAKLSRGSLKQAIVMKEILEKPITLRNKKPGIFPYGDS
jgi:hypothetical protein